MLKNKYFIKFTPLGALGFSLFSSAILSVNSLAVLLLINMRGTRYSSGDIYMFAFSFALFSILFYYWKRCTFGTGDIAAILQERGYDFNSYLSNILLDLLEFKISVYGQKGKSKIYARIDMPFLHVFVLLFQLFYKPRKSFSLTPGYYYRLSKVTFLSPFRFHVEREIEITLMGDDGITPSIGVPEIDNITKEMLNETDDFHAKVKIDGNALQVTIIGGSWLGRKFRNRIEKGFELFERLDSELKDKYNSGSFDYYDVKWSRKDDTFVLVNNKGI